MGSGNSFIDELASSVDNQVVFGSLVADESVLQITIRVIVTRLVGQIYPSPTAHVQGSGTAVLLCAYSRNTQIFVQWIKIVIAC